MFAKFSIFGGRKYLYTTSQKRAFLHTTLLTVNYYLLVTAPIHSIGKTIMLE